MAALAPEQSVLSTEGSGTKVIRCSGTPYEIGFTHGSYAADEIHGNIAIYADFFKDRANLSWAQARERAANFIPILAAHYPDILDEMRGIAEGAGKGLTLEDILTLNARSELGLTNFSDGCTSLSQRGSSGNIFLAQNWDWLETLLIVLHIRPNNSPLEMKFMSEAGLVGKIGLNSAGVGTLLNGILAGALCKDKFPIHVMLRRILQFASTLDEAVATINKYGIASTANIVIADKQGNAGSIECSPHGNAVIPMQTHEFPFVGHTNHLYSPDRPAAAKDHPEDNSFTRLARLEELTRLDEMPPSFDSIRSRLSDEQGTPVSICLGRPPKDAQGMDKVTTVSTIIMELNAGIAELTIGRPCDKSLPVIKWQLQ